MTDQPIEDTTDEVDTAPEVEETVEDTTEEDTFPREYVEKLRDESAKYRQRAGKADDLARRVHRLMVEQTGLLADPEDLEYDEEHLDDPEKLQSAVNDLLARKPHLAARRPRGDVGQGVTDNAPTDLAAILRRAAG